MVNIRPSPNEPNEPGRSSSSSLASRPDRLIVHTSFLVNSKAKTFDKDISIEIDTKTGLFTSVETRGSALPLQLAPNEIDLRGSPSYPVSPMLIHISGSTRIPRPPRSTRNETSPLSRA